VVGDDESPRRKPVAKAAEQIVPIRKLAKPRVLYLTELIIDVDRTLVELAANEPAKAVQLYKSAVAQAKKRGDSQAEREALSNLAAVYYLTGQLTRAKENYEQALVLIKKLNAVQEEAVALRNLAAAFTAAGEYADAEEYNRDALKIFEQTGNLKAKRMVLSNLGVLEKIEAGRS
jgi:tetratricopeptide (TPR) repeat protein